MSQATLHDRPYVNSNLFSSHYLDERISDRDEWECDDAARETLEQLQDLYDSEGPLVSGYGEDALIDNWIDEVLDALGFGTQVEVTLPNGGGYVDALLFEDTSARREAASIYLDTEDTTDLFDRGIGLVEAKQWDADFTERFSEHRPYRNASHQIKHYQENTPENIQWSILTNGRKWRLYGTKDYETQTYYEVDLPELIERGDLDAFKYFYVFFSPSAFRKSADTTFLDEVWSESETAAQELGEDLQDNVFTALRVLGRGFVETNDQGIEPDDVEALDELKEQSLVLLYRLMFVLYAESRGLIHPDNPSAVEEYEENFSLDELRVEIHDAIGEVDEGFEDEFSDHSTTMWSRLEDLFGLIDEGEESLGIPPYNGGLFDHDQHEFLTENEVSNRYLAEVIYRLSTTQNDEGRYVLADYGDLDTRHLGSVYEGLLEHQFRIAPEDYAAVEDNGGQIWEPATEVTVSDVVEKVPEGGLYVVNDKGERKATGAYYTPDYVVTYIVEETVGPLVDEIRDDLIEQGFEPGTHEYLGPFLQRITGLRILDPAMGSGHFLTKATGYLSERVMAEVRDVEEEMGVDFDEQHVRREIAKECIYGVDLNGMAVELAKLSMWLETLAADRPLAFLDHHFKEGNSLVGSNIESIEELESDTNGDEGQYSLADFGATREGTIERLMDIYSKFLAIENETIEDVSRMKRKYAEIEQDELRKRLVAMANVHTAEGFEFTVPGGAYERMAKALEDDDDWKTVTNTDWFTTAQTIAEEQNFFHWRLAFPEVFYQENGSVKSDPGFDAVIGNPPYVNSKYLSEELKYYLEKVFDSTTGRWDVYLPFTEKALEIYSGYVGYIEPSMFFRREYGKGLRNFISSETFVSEIVDFSDLQVFEDATNYVAIIILTKENIDEVNAIVPNSITEFLSESESLSYKLQNENLTADPWDVVPPDVIRIRQNFPQGLVQLGDITDSITEGIHSGRDNVYYVDEEDVENWDLESDLIQPLLKGEHISRYLPPSTNLFVIYPYEDDDVLTESNMSSNYPNTWDYLQENRDILEERDYLMESGYNWYELWRKRERRIYENPKLLLPMISDGNNLTIDRGNTEYFFNTKAKSIKLENNSEPYLLTLLGVLNSKLLEFIYKGIAPPKRGGFRAYTTGFLSELKVPSKIIPDITKESDKILELKAIRQDVNLNILDYIRPYTNGQELANVGTYQPPEGVGDSILAATAKDYENVRVGTVKCEIEEESSAVIYATARYKPDERDGHETDQWGYTETEPIPAIRLTNLTDTEANLIGSFVPLAVEKAEGFANFRETATQTNSLIDRLEVLTLPDPDDVAEDLDRYMEAVERTQELDEKIERTDELIDEIVYELYELTDEEIEVVEQAVADE